MRRHWGEREVHRLFQFQVGIHMKIVRELHCFQWEYAPKLTLAQIWNPQCGKKTPNMTCYFYAESRQIPHRMAKSANRKWKASQISVVDSVIDFLKGNNPSCEDTQTLIRAVSVYVSASLFSQILLISPLDRLLWAAGNLTHQPAGQDWMIHLGGRGKGREADCWKLIGHLNSYVPQTLDLEIHKSWDRCTIQSTSTRCP